MNDNWELGKPIGEGPRSRGKQPRREIPGWLKFVAIVVGVMLFWWVVR